MIALAAVLFLSPQAPIAPTVPATPSQVEWQRSLEDALAVQKATGLPLLIAVNMDGERFNELFATQTYRDARFVEWTRGYVCVVASPDRHTGRDYDAQGRRVECPRFPGCTCSEHIAIEPELFARWFSGTRNAPRHVGVGKNGKVLFDRFLDASMQTAIDAIQKHRGTPKADAALPTAPEALLARRDAAARRALAARYLAGDAATRRSLLAAAAKADTQPMELVHMGLFDPDDATLTAAAAALATLADRRLLPEIEQALARVDDAVVRTALLARLAEFGREEPTVARLVANLTPSATPPSLPMPWSGPWHEPAFAGQDRASIEAELDRREAFLRTTPNDDAARLGLATAQAAFANVLIEERGRGIDFWFEDSRRNAARVQDAKLQQEAQALLAHVAYMTGDTEGARRATAAAQAASAGARAPDPWLASRLLELVVLATVNGVYADPEAAQQRNLRPEIDRVSAALDLLLARGRPADKPALAGIGLLEFAGLRREPRLLLDRLVTLLPKSADVHERWRGRMLADLGADPMRQRSAGLADAAADQPTAQWFAGYAALIAAERHMQDHRPDAARSAYDAAIERLGRAAGDDEAMAVSAHHFAVLAHAGRAHLRFAAGDASGAVDDLVRAAALRPESLDESDGLLRKPRAMAARIAEALTAQGQAELAARLQPILR